MHGKPEVVFGEHPLTIEDVNAIASGKVAVTLSKHPSFCRKIDSALAFLDKLLKEDGVIYGVTTGYGDSVTTEVPSSLVPALPLHLSRFHGCGLGEYFSKSQGRAILATRLASLSKGYSGVSWELLHLLVDMVNNDIVPRIPQEGSVGASGDLTPLSYLAGALVGERDVYFDGKICQSAEAFQSRQLSPIALRPKEGLAIMNGTAVMTAIACEAFSRAEYLMQLMTRITALCSLALKGNSNHFDDKLFAAKPHAGQQQIAAWIQQDLNHFTHPRNSHRLQDRYSIRCAPHVIGTLADALPWLRSLIENELNSANDNPLIDGEGEHVLHGGHFYGGHIAMAMDTLKVLVANQADLADRQLASLVDTRYNNGLAPNLSGADPTTRFINHGFKAVQIGASAYTAEALKHTMPASVFSRSTECHNQDKVSMGTIASRDALRVLQLTEQVLASTLLGAVQALRLRFAQGELDKSTLTSPVIAMYDDIVSFFEPLTQDRPLEALLRYTVEAIENKRWSLYEQS